jgi:hypothetical protein
MFRSWAGWGFGLHEAMDQIGAIIGPLIVALVLFFNGSYQTSFAIPSKFKEFWGM